MEDCWRPPQYACLTTCHRESDFTKQIKGKKSQISQVQFCSLSAPWACPSRTSVQVDYIFYTYLKSSVWLFSTSFIKWASLIYLISQASNLQKSSTHSTEHAVQAVSIKEEVECHNRIMRTKVLMMMMIWTSGQRESFFQSRDENESFSDSISFIETRPRIPDTYSQASRRDREKISSNLRHRDEIEIYYLHSQTSRREREFPWSDLVFRDETENSETCHLSLKSGLNGLTIYILNQFSTNRC